MYRASSGEDAQLSENAIFSPDMTNPPADAKNGDAENSPKQAVAAQIESTFGIASPSTTSKGESNESWSCLTTTHLRATMCTSRCYLKILC